MSRGSQSDTVVCSSEAFPPAPEGILSMEGSQGWAAKSPSKQKLKSPKNMIFFLDFNYYIVT